MRLLGLLLTIVSSREIMKPYYLKDSIVCFPNDFICNNPFCVSYFVEYFGNIFLEKKSPLVLAPCRTRTKLMMIWWQRQLELRNIRMINKKTVVLLIKVIIKSLVIKI